MELHPRQLLEIVEKPLSLATKFIFGLADSKFIQSSGRSQTAHYKPSPSTHSPITSNPLVPACIVLLIGFLIVSISPVRVWLAKTEDLPTLAQIFSFSRKKRADSLPWNAVGVRVWTKKQSGFYYCQGGTLFGNKPGQMMTQSVALTWGYRPVGGTYCANSPSDGLSADSGQSSAPVAEIQPGTPVPAKDVEVWGLKQLGFYYCRGDVLFGVRPGRLMKQADALADGLEPSYHNCPGSEANLVSTGDLSLGNQPSSSPANISLPSAAPSTFVSGKPADISQAGGHVDVWVKKQFGFYYCRNDVLFGNRPGQLMSQAEALSAGYQPSDDRCSEGKTTQATAERLSPEVFPRKN